MARKRPVSFVVFAILNFIAALSFIGCGVCANVIDAQPWFVEINNVRWDEKKLTNHLKEKVPAYTPVKVGGIVTGYAVCIGLILAGVALLFGGLWSKLFAILVYACGVLHHLVMIVYQLVWVDPAINQFFDQIPPAIFVGRAPAEATRFTAQTPGYISITWWVLGILFYLVAALVVLLSSTAERGSEDEEEDEPIVAKKSKRRRDRDDDEDDDDEDDRPRKKRSKR